MTFRPLGYISILLLIGCTSGGEDASPLDEARGAVPVDSATPAPVASETEPVEGDTTAVQWIVGVTDVEHDISGAALLTGVRAAENLGFDRVVLEFEGGELPSYHVEYIDRPVRQCGSGEVVEIAGDGWLSVRVEPANAHTEAGESTIAERSRQPELSVLRELTLICDFEAQVEWVLGVSSPNPYRVLELADPARLVVDVQH